MSYKRASKSAYAQRRMRKQLPSLNYAFRSAWESNIDRALARIEELKSQGWNVDVERGALTQNQADLLADEAERMGCEVERIPVAEWGEELKDLAQFIAYKHKEGGETPPIIPKIQAQEKPSRTVQSAMTPEQVMNAYVKEFFTKGREPDPNEVKTGYLLDPTRCVAMIRRDFSSSTPNTIVDSARKLMSQGSQIEEFENTAKIRQSLRNAKKLAHQPKYVTLGSLGTGNHVKINYFEKALKVLGKGRIRVYAEKEDGPVYVVNSQRDIVAIAPALSIDDTDRIPFRQLRKV